MNISIGSRTDIGGRSNNEDSLAVLDSEEYDLRVDAAVVIADGMGGQANGEEASGVAVSLIKETLVELLDPAYILPMPPAEEILEAGFRRANSKVYAISQQTADAPPMGTTCISAIIAKGLFTFAHVGDSRAYLIRDGSIKALTIDHTYVAEQVRAGNLTADAAKKSRFRNVITKAIGIAPTVKPDFGTFALLYDDTILLCTDGLTNTVDDDDILQIVAKSESAQGCASALVDASKAAGARDNITVIAIRASKDDIEPPIKQNGSSNGHKVSKFSPETSTASFGFKVKPKVEPLDLNVSEQQDNADFQSSGFRIVVVAVLSAILGAAAAAGAFYEIGFLKPVHQILVKSAPVPPAAAVLPSKLALLGAVYTTPIQVFYKPVRPDFLEYRNGTLYVAGSQSGKLIHLNASGQVINVLSSKVPDQDPNSTGDCQIDRFGNIYYTDSNIGTITLENSNDGTKRVIANGLNSPDAIAVNEQGDIYFVEDGQLEVLHPAFSPGKQ